MHCAPAGLTATGNANQIVLNWTESISEDVTAYNIYRSENGNDFAKIGEVPVGNHRFTDGSAITSPAQTGVLYYYQVKAFGKAESSPSNVARNVRGPCMAHQSATLNIGNGETMVVDGTVSVPGGISVESGGKLFLMGKSTLQFSNYGNPVELNVAGLLRIVAS